MMYSRRKNCSRWSRVMIQDTEAAPDPGCDHLTVRGAAVPAQTTTVTLTVTGLLIKATVAQVFTNPTDEVIDAEYVFPLPDRAAVNAMTLQVGEHRLVSVVQEKEEARRTYQQARDSGHRAALLSSQRPTATPRPRSRTQRRSALRSDSRTIPGSPQRKSWCT